MTKNIVGLLERAIEERLFSGCSFHLFNGDEVQEGSFGQYSFPGEMDCKRSIDHDALFDIASITKVEVAIAILCLVNRGFIKLDDPVVAYVPFKVAGITQEMTIFHLLTCGVEFELPLDIRTRGIHLKNAEGGLRFLDEATLLHPPGSIFKYRNPPSFILGLVIECVTGLNLESALEKLVFKPLCMSDSSFKMNMVRRQRAVPTQRIDAPGVLQFGIMQDLMTFGFWPSPVGISGSFASLEDMAKLVRFLATGLTPNGEWLISESLWQRMVSDQHAETKFADGKKHRYGLGIDVPDEGYVDDADFCERGVFMSAASGVFVFAHPRPFGGVILTSKRLDVPDPAVHRIFRRKFVATALGSFTH